jgi:hypothetical protein
MGGRAVTYYFETRPIKDNLNLPVILLFGCVLGSDQLSLTSEECVILQSGVVFLVLVSCLTCEKRVILQSGVVFLVLSTQLQIGELHTTQR